MTLLSWFPLRFAYLLIFFFFDFFFFLFGMIPLLVCSNLLVYLDVPALGTVVYMWRERLCIIHGMVNRFCFRRKSLEFSMSVTLVDLCS